MVLYATACSYSLQVLAGPAVYPAQGLQPVGLAEFKNV